MNPSTTAVWMRQAASCCRLAETSASPAPWASHSSAMPVISRRMKGSRKQCPISSVITIPMRLTLPARRMRPLGSGPA